MKKIFLTYMIIIILNTFFINSVTAYTGDHKFDYLYYNIINGEIEITDYVESAKDIVIPREIEGIPVTSIGEYALVFGKITNVTIPESVVNIGRSAFDPFIKNIYYAGNEDSWNDVLINSGNNFDYLQDVTIHFNSTGEMTTFPSVKDVVVRKDDGGYEFEVSVKDMSCSSTIVTALYNGNKLLGAQAAAAEKDNIIFVPSEQADTAKVFIWDSASGMKPYSETKTISISD